MIFKNTPCLKTDRFTKKSQQKIDDFQASHAGYSLDWRSGIFNTDHLEQVFSALFWHFLQTNQIYINIYTDIWKIK